jgi:hypothetical protein
MSSLIWSKKIECCHHDNKTIINNTDKPSPLHPDSFDELETDTITRLAEIMHPPPVGKVVQLDNSGAWNQRFCTLYTDICGQRILTILAKVMMTRTNIWITNNSMTDMIVKWKPNAS